MSVLPPKGDYVRTSVSLPRETWDAVEALLKEVNSDRDPPDRLSRDEFLRYMLEWACRELPAEMKSNNSKPHGRKA